MAKGLSEKQAKEKFRQYVRLITPLDRVLVLFHGDTDGLCSAVITDKSLAELRGRGADKAKPLSHEKRTISPEDLKLVKKGKYNKVIILDWNVDQDAKAIKKLEKLAEVLIVDHHKIYHHLDSKRTTFIKAHYLTKKEPSRYPVSKMVYDLFGREVDVKAMDWIALTGLIGDSSAKVWPAFVKQVMKRHKFGKEVEKSKASKVSQLITGLESLKKEKLVDAFELMVKAKKPETVLKSPLRKYAQTLDKEIDKWFKAVKKKAEFYPEAELVYYEVKSKYYIKSPLINRLSHQLYPKKTVIVVLDQGKAILKVSARRQDLKVKVNELLEKSLVGGSGGGHVPAAAGILPRKNLKVFKSNIISLLSK